MRAPIPGIVDLTERLRLAIRRAALREELDVQRALMRQTIDEARTILLHAYRNPARRRAAP